MRQEILCFEMQRPMHRIVRSHGNKRGTIGSRSTSAVILTKYSAVRKRSRREPVDFGAILLQYSDAKDRSSYKHSPDPFRARSMILQSSYQRIFRLYSVVFHEQKNSSLPIFKKRPGLCRNGQCRLQGPLDALHRISMDTADSRRL
ncbi:uncharacterized protein LOC143305719 isoform X1 [Osmia lignaria lignaria]|uniref:uncharacterized protein LOC143305719 isoform X1 n=1 Tax=Osmia lignaria lignaria TaxID=1437193 RepID=UPI00402B9C7F